VTTHQLTRLANLTSRGNLAFTREENLRKLACECLELALVIEHHFEGKRNLFDLALEGADVAVMLHRELVEPPGAAVGNWWNLRRVSDRALATSLAVGQFLDGEITDVHLQEHLCMMGCGLNFVRQHVTEQNWTLAVDVKLSKAERYISERESGTTPVSLREVVNG
jgi:hypothetical protein